jgi:TatD DNase family protein
MLDLIDTHAHIQGEEFDADRDETVRRAVGAGVRAIVVPGVDSQTSDAALVLAERSPHVYATAGFHPHEASRLTEGDLEHVEALLGQEKVVAVGEIGLDFYRRHSEPEAQVRALESMLELAARHLLPVVVHCREAQETLWPILQSWAGSVRAAFGDRPLGVMHYFSGTPPQAEAYAALGFMVSVHTSVTHPRAKMLRDVVAAMPLETLVIETDSPYGAPQVFRGKRNEPAHVREAAAKIAEVKQTDVEVVASATTANACRVFGLKLPAASGRTTGAAF